MSKITNETKLLMANIKNSIIDYLTEELEINSTALKPYEGDKLLPESTNTEILKMREIEAIKLRDRMHQLTSYIAVIKRMIPTGNK